MRKGSEAALMFDKNGQIFAFSTGSDYVSEHEWGSKPMQDALCAPMGSRAGTGLWVFVPGPAQVQEVCMVRSAEYTEDDLIAELRAGNSVKFPDLTDRKALGQNLDQLEFVVGQENGEPVAVFGYSAYGPGNITVNHRELTLSGKECIGAWDDSSFAIKVRGAKLVGKLKRFADFAKGGNALFAGSFIKSIGKSRSTGVVIALATGLRPEHRVEIKKSQAEWEDGLRLKAASRIDELKALAYDTKSNPSARMPGYIWPLWSEGKNSEVVYGLNPDRESYGPYLGPYTYEELKKWILAETKFRLTPVERKVPCPAD